MTVESATDFVACASDFVARATDFVACATDFMACAINFVARATDFVACGMLITTPPPDLFLKINHIKKNIAIHENLPYCLYNFFVYVPIR